MFVKSIEEIKGSNEDVISVSFKPSTWNTSFEGRGESL